MLRPSNSDDRLASASQPVGNTVVTRTGRLAEEYHRLARDFAFHPLVKVIPVSGEPPEAYQVEFRVRTVTFESAQRKLHYVDAVALVLVLPASYPDAPPQVHPPEGLFHPNADEEQVQIHGAWQRGDWLVDLVPKLGELLAYRMYDPESVLNPEALNWQEANVKVLPTDKSGDFSIAAGGSPKQRIAKYAAARINEVRRVLQAASLRLADGQIDADAIETTATQAKYVLHPLLADAGAPPIAAAAKELTAWADALPATLPAWYALRDRQSRLAASERALDSLAKAGQPLSDGLSELSAMFTGDLATKPSKAIGQIPPAEALAPLVPKLSGALIEAQQQEEQARKTLAEFADYDAAHPPADSPPAHPPDSQVAKLLADRQSALAASCEKLAARAGPALDHAADLLRRGRAEATALQRLADWRDYLDQFTVGSALAREVIEQGPAGAQAFKLESFGKAYGPYQFEQAVTFGNMHLAIGRDGEKLQIIDGATGDIVGSRAAAVISLKLPANGSEATLTVRAGLDCVASAAQLDAARQRTFDTLSRLHETVPDSQSWCGKLLAVLCEPTALAAIHAEHRRSSHRWDRLAEDLLLLAPLKDRLATYYLVGRSAASASALSQKRAAAEKKQAEATDRLAALAARCGHDPDTGNLLIPPQLAQPYAQATTDRQSAIKEIQRIDRRRQVVAEQVSARLADPARVGRAELPAFRRLGTAPPDLVDATAAAADAALTKSLAALAAELGAQFPPLVAAKPVDLSVRRREKRPADAPARAVTQVDEADQALAARPEDSLADVVVAEPE